MLRYYAKHSRGENFQEIQQPQKNMWVLAEHITRNETVELTKRFTLDPNTLGDVHDPDELSRIDHGSNEDTLYVFLRMISRTAEGDIHTAPIAAILQENIFLSVAQKSAKDVRVVIEQKTSSLEDTRPVALFLATFMAVIGKYEEEISVTHKSIVKTRELLRARLLDKRNFLQFVTIEDDLNQYQMNLQGMHTVAERLTLQQNSARFVAEDTETIEDIALYIQQLLTAVQSHTQTVNSIRNAYSALADANLNERMRRLTILTVLITLPNVFYGMYGMNIPLPFQQESWAYLAMMGLTVFIVIFTYLIAKRSRIL